MACYHPLLAVPYPSSHEKYGQYLILGSAFDHGNFNKIPNFERVDRENGIDLNTGQFLEPIRIPCGKCLGCRLDRSRDMATRIVCESMDYPAHTNWFVTLTYAQPDDLEWLPRLGARPSVNADGALTLDGKHPTDFLKRLRDHHARKVGYDYDVPLWYDALHDQYVPMGLRYFLAGEYGDRSMRPHYHACILNMPLNDIKLIGHTVQGNPLYNSSLLTDTWGFGHVVLAPMSYQTAAYTARYCLKKADGVANEVYESMNLVPEFTRVSRRPGIGARYLLEHAQEIYAQDELVLPAISKDKPNKQRPPKYLDLKYKEIDPKHYAEISSRRREVAQSMAALKLSETDLDECKYFALQERTKSAQVKKLLREL